MLEMRLFRNQQKEVEWQGILSAAGIAKPVRAEVGSPMLQREEVGFWQEANQIHGWIVDNVQKGDDDRQEHYINRNQLADLHAAVQEVLENSSLVLVKQSQGRSWYDELINGVDDRYVIKDPSVAKQLLPRREGFFFGSMEYDQEYLEQLRHTRTILRQALLSPREAVFSYRADW